MEREVQSYKSDLNKPERPSRRDWLCRAIFMIFFALWFEPVIAADLSQLHVRVENEGQPIIVFSTDGKKFTDIDYGTELKFGIRIEYWAAGQARWRVLGHDATTKIQLQSKSSEFFTIREVDSGNRRGKVGGHIKASVAINYRDPIGLSPISLCNNRLNKEISENPGKPAWEFMRYGFNVPLPAAYRIQVSTKVKVKLTRTRGVLSIRTENKTNEYSSARIASLPSFVECKGTNLARPPEPEPEPARRTEIKKEPEVTVRRTTKTAKRVKCPAKVHFTGKIKFPEPGEYTYFFKGNSDAKTGKKKLRVNGKGEKEFYWTRNIKSQSRSTTGTAGSFAVAGNQNKVNVKGWTQLVVVARPESGGRGIYKSDPAKFTVKCK